MRNSFESWKITSKMLGKVMGIMGFFRKNFVGTLLRFEIIGADLKDVFFSILFTKMFCSNQKLY